MKGNGMDEELNTNDVQGFDEGDELLDDQLYTVLDDEAREDLEQLVDLKIVGLDVWEDSLSDAEDEEPVKPEERLFFDCDLLFEDGLALELYAAAVYPDPEGEPIKGMDEITRIVGQLADGNLQLLDFDQADEESGLALAFGSSQDKTDLVIAAGAWLVSEWEEETEAPGEEQ